MMLSSGPLAAPRGRSLIPDGSRLPRGGASCLLAILLVAMFGLITVMITTLAQGSGAAVSIAVDRATEVAKVSPLIFGVNTACWDEQLFPGTADNWELTFDQVGVRRVKDAGIRFLRFPGGRDGDDYIWNSPSNSPLRMDTDEFMTFCKLVGATPSITVNYTEKPDLAAEWVRYANRVKGYGVRYWEVGDEEYFLVDGGSYAARFSHFARAMKAQDPSIKVGANISPSRPDWSRRVLRDAGSYIDFVVHNWYPQSPRKEDDTYLLSTPPRLAQDVAAIRKMLKDEVPARANEIKVHIGGYNSVSYAPGPQTTSHVNALWLADVLGTMAGAGVDAAGFWALHNVYPPRQGDYGIITSTPENAPYPTYHVFQLFKDHFGDVYLRSSSSDNRVVVHASAKGDSTRGTIHLIVVNRASEDAYADLRVAGFSCGPRAEVWVLGAGGGPPARISDAVVTNGHARLRLPSRSVVAVTIPGRAAPPPRLRNLALRAKVTASSTAEVDGMFRPESAVDGSMRTRWASRIWQKVPEWFQVDLGSKETVGSVVLHWELGATRYTVQVSKDGTAWETVAEKTSSGAGWEVVEFAPREARYVKLLLYERPKDIGTKFGHSLWTTWGFSLWEIEVYVPGDAPSMGR
ncbi:MAG: hypothetical protein GX492_02735 [Firmicutes bacterium]|nr:hypothetical protein [Bacillota bacterium]